MTSQTLCTVSCHIQNQPPQETLQLLVHRGRHACERTMGVWPMTTLVWPRNWVPHGIPGQAARRFRRELRSENNLWQQWLTSCCPSNGITPDGDRMTLTPADAHSPRCRAEAVPVSRFTIRSTESAPFAPLSRPGIPVRGSNRCDPPRFPGRNRHRSSPPISITYCTAATYTIIGLGACLPGCEKELIPGTSGAFARCVYGSVTVR